MDDDKKEEEEEEEEEGEQTGAATINSIHCWVSIQHLNVSYHITGQFWYTIKATCKLPKYLCEVGA